MPRTRPPYPPEFRRQIVELVRAGRSMREVAQEFEPSYETIREWVRQANRDEGLDLSGPTTDEKEELRRLRRENHRAPAGAGDLGKSRGLTLWEPGSVPRKRTDS